jgi:RNA polymerase sigma-70 factor (ECF subfamily)
MPYSDEQLIKQILKGDKSATRQLYQRHQRYWNRICLRYAKNRTEAEDMLQEGLVMLFKNLSRFDAAKGNFKGWSNQVIIHAILDYLKKHSWQQSFETLTKDHDILETADRIFDKLAAKELIELIQHLPTGYRVVFNLYVIEGYSHQEIAERLNISVGTSKSQLSKAKKALRKKIEIIF